jgi:hypothetical protein
VIAELRVSQAAFYRWRRQGAGPAVVRLPGGGVRVRRSALTAWLRRLEAFYACLYYAALRPSEAVMLRESDLHPPKKGWGRIVLAASAHGAVWGETRKQALTPPSSAPRSADAPTTCATPPCRSG